MEVGNGRAHLSALPTPAPVQSDSFRRFIFWQDRPNPSLSLIRKEDNLRTLRFTISTRTAYGDLQVVRQSDYYYFLLGFGFFDMGSTDEVIEIDVLERRLLSATVSNEYTEADEDTVLYTASFREMEENYVKYQTAQWILYSLLLILAWGIGLLMLLYLPVRRYVLRKDFCSRKLYVTPKAIVYEVSIPVAFPCCGVLKKEKHVVLASVADILIEQGYLQSLFGIYSVRIQNVGVRRPANDDVQIQGISDPRAFRRAVLVRTSNMRNDSFSKHISITEDSQLIGSAPSGVLMPSLGDMVLQKLEEIGSLVKKVQAFIENKSQAPVLTD